MHAVQPPPEVGRVRRSLRYLGVLAIALGLALIYKPWWPYYRSAIQTVVLNLRDQLQGKERLQAAPLVAVAPVPLPKRLPLIGKAGRDHFGYPFQHLDVPAMRSLLYYGQYARYLHYVEQLQAQFEADWTKERLVRDALDPIVATGFNGLNSLNALIAKRPEAFSGYLLRGRYYQEIANSRRGVQAFRDTSPEDLKAMEEFNAKALADLDQAIKLRPKLIAAMNIKAQILSVSGKRAELRRLLRQADAACPLCITVPQTYLYYLDPRWGGSYEEIGAYADRYSDSANPRQRTFVGTIYNKRASVEEGKKNYKVAMLFIDRSCKERCNNAVYAIRALIKADLHDLRGAKADIEASLALEPNFAYSYIQLASIERRLGHADVAAQRLLDGWRIDPERRLADETERTIDALKADAIHLGRLAGGNAAVMQKLDLILELDPNEPWALATRAAALGGEGEPPGGKRLAALAKGDANDFLQQLKLAAAYGRLKRFSEQKAVWNAYLASHSGHALAYFERGSVEAQLGQDKEAAADMKKGCELGCNRACIKMDRSASDAR